MYRTEYDEDDARLSYERANSGAPMNQFVQMKLPAKAENTLAVRLLIAGLANLCEFNSDEIGDLKLAVSEACAFTHNGSRWLDLSVNVNKDGLAIEIESENQPQKPMIAPDDAALSGIGFMLMQNLVDSMEYKSVDGARPGEKRTWIRLTKKRG